jgi:glutamate 5-kinase
MKLVIKIGTSTITKPDGSLNTPYINAFGKTLAEIKKSSNEIIIVSSGAIGAGLGHLKLKERPKTVPEKQALAAIGQPQVVRTWRESLGAYKISVAQVLLTRGDFDDKTRHANMKNTLKQILSYGAIPIINENDTVAVDEIKFGDNDTLAANVAVSTKADMLFIFTDVDGLYCGTPKKSALIKVVGRITKKIRAMARGTSIGGKGTGGMTTKLNAAQIATAAGIKTVILNGKKFKLLDGILKGAPCGTLFTANKQKIKND